jgi:prevent-host-death family protein
MAQFSVYEAKTKLSQLIADTLAGADVVITRGNVPAVRLVPVEPRGRRQFGALKGKIAFDGQFNDVLPPEVLDGWNLA